MLKNSELCRALACSLRSRRSCTCKAFTIPGLYACEEKPKGPKIVLLANMRFCGKVGSLDQGRAAKVPV